MMRGTLLLLLPALPIAAQQLILIPGAAVVDSTDARIIDVRIIDGLRYHRGGMR